MNRIENYLGATFFLILGLLLWFVVCDDVMEQPLFNLTQPAIMTCNIIVFVICPVGFIWNIYSIFKKIE